LLNAVAVLERFTLCS